MASQLRRVLRSALLPITDLSIEHGEVAAPTNLSAPVVTGALTQGATLSTTPGTWTGSPSGYSYQWKRDGADIGSATNATYVTQAADVGTSVACEVTATNGAGASSPAASNGKIVTAFVATTWSATDKTANLVRSNSNKTATMAADGAGARSSSSRNASHGKVYVELTVAAHTVGEDVYFGLASDEAYLVEDFNNYPPNSSLVSIYCFGPQSGVNIDGNSRGFGRALQGDVICLAIDLPNHLLWARTGNGDWNGSPTSNPASGTDGIDYTAAGFVGADLFLWCRGFAYGSAAPAITINTGPVGFDHTVPTGFGGWDDPNLPFGLGAVLAPFSDTILSEDFAALSLRSGGPTVAGYDGGSGIWTPRIGNDETAKGSTHLEERQFYADPAFAWAGGFSPFTVASSVLTIRAQTTPGAIAAQMPVNVNTGLTYDYVAGLLTTKHSFKFKPPVLVEARMKLPKGKAIWPTLWTLPSDEDWPPEIDIAEYDGAQPNKLNVGTFTGTWDDFVNRSQFSDLGLGDLSVDYHVFGVAWFEDVLIFTVDGGIVAQLPGHSEFDQFHYLLLNVAVGGAFVDEPDNTTPSPADLLVDWVRVKGMPDTEFVVS